MQNWSKTFHFSSSPSIRETPRAEQLCATRIASSRSAQKIFGGSALIPPSLHSSLYVSLSTCQPPFARETNKSIDKVSAKPLNGENISRRNWKINENFANKSVKKLLHNWGIHQTHSTRRALQECLPCEHAKLPLKLLTSKSLGKLSISDESSQPSVEQLDGHGNKKIRTQSMDAPNAKLINFPSHHLAFSR